MTTRTAQRPQRRTTRTDTLAQIARDMRAYFAAPTNGCSWVQRRWAPDVDIVLQRRRSDGGWRLAATCASGAAPDEEAQRMLALAFGAPVDDWHVKPATVKGISGDRSIYIAEVTWTERD